MGLVESHPDDELLPALAWDEVLAMDPELPNSVSLPAMPEKAGARRKGAWDGREWNAARVFSRVRIENNIRGVGWAIVGRI